MREWSVDAFRCALVVALCGCGDPSSHPDSEVDSPRSASVGIQPETPSVMPGSDAQAPFQEANAGTELSSPVSSSSDSVVIPEPAVVPEPPPTATSESVVGANVGSGSAVATSPLPLSFYVDWTPKQVRATPVPVAITEEVPVEGPLLIRTYLMSGGEAPPAEDLLPSGEFSADALTSHVRLPFIRLRRADAPDTEEWTELGPDGVVSIREGVAINYMPIGPPLYEGGQPTYFAIPFDENLEPATTYTVSVHLFQAETVLYEFTTAAEPTPPLEAPSILSLMGGWYSSEESPDCSLFFDVGSRVYCVLRTHQLELVANVDWHASSGPTTLYGLWDGGVELALSPPDPPVAPPATVALGAFAYPEPVCVLARARRMLDGSELTDGPTCLELPPLPTIAPDRALVSLKELAVSAQEASGASGDDVQAPAVYFEGTFFDF